MYIHAHTLICLSLSHTHTHKHTRTSFSLTRTAENSTYTGLFKFPCFTSDFKRAGQLVQIIFTLEVSVSYI